MTTPLTDQQLAAIDADMALAHEGKLIGVPRGAERFEAAVRVADYHARTLLAEVHRLRADAEQARATALREAADLLADRGYHLPADLVLRLPAVPTTPACSCRAEAVHQAGCDTDRHA